MVQIIQEVQKMDKVCRKVLIEQFESNGVACVPAVRSLVDHLMSVKRPSFHVVVLGKSAHKTRDAFLVAANTLEFDYPEVAQRLVNAANRIRLC